MAFSQGAADVGLGLVLLVSAGALASGAFDVGTLALFVAYLGWLSFLPRMVGRMLARRKQATVAVDRMRQLVAERGAGQHRAAAGAAARAAPARRAAGRPSAPSGCRCSASRCAACRRRYPGGAGVHDVSFPVDRGELRRADRARSARARARCCGPSSAWRGRPTSSARCAGTASCCATAPRSWCRRTRRSCPRCPQLVSDSVRDNVGLGPVPRRRPRPGADAGRHRRRRRRAARRRATR